MRPAISIARGLFTRWSVEIFQSELHGSAQERKTRPYGEEVLSVRNLSMGSIVRNTSFSVFSGQITGMFGLVGAGRTETMKIIGGVLKRDFFHGGEVRLNGRRVRYRTRGPRSSTVSSM